MIDNIIMNSRRFAILFIFLLSILTVSCVSAQDLNSSDSLMLSQDSNHSEIIGSSYDNQSILVSDSIESEPLSSSPSVQNDRPEGTYGIVDFGTNSFALKIYDVHNGVITNNLSLSEVSVVSKYTQDNRLTPEGIEKLISQFESYLEVMQSNGVTNEYFFATSSLRKIDNRDEVVAAVKDRLGIYIDVINGVKEAELGFKAVREMDLTTDRGLLIDLGGGSCEITYFTNKTLVMGVSMPFGSNSAYNEYVSGTFPDETERLKIQNRTLIELKKLAINNTAPYDDLFGTGGTVYTIKLMLISLGIIDEDETFVPVSKIDELLDDIKEDTEENRQKIIDVAPNRLYNLIPGIIITKTILEYYNVTYLHFCNGQLDDGVLFELLENESSKLSANLTRYTPTSVSDELLENESSKDKHVSPSLESESSNSSSETPSEIIKQDKTVMASSKLISYPTGNPIGMMVLVLFSIFISYRKRRT